MTLVDRNNYFTTVESNSPQPSKEDIDVMWTAISMLATDRGKKTPVGSPKLVTRQISEKLFAHRMEVFFV